VTAVHALTIVLPVAVPDELATAEATDVTLIGDALETVDVGPFDGAYYRLSATDLVVAVDRARRLLNEIETAVLDARQDRYQALLRPCPWCSTLIEPDEDDCGSGTCARAAAAEQAVEAYI
jgi:hypothetical protein